MASFEVRWCPVCGQQLPARVACGNQWCSRADRAFSVVFSVGCHDGALRRAIVEYKYCDQRWRAGPFAEMLAGYLDVHAPWFEEFEVLVPVPAFHGPGARRSWDPVGLIFHRLVALVGSAWECSAEAIVKIAETVPMSGRSRPGRLAVAQGSLRQALVVTDPTAIRQARVLVIDDVLTDGSTLREVSLALRQAGAAEVAGLVLARPRWRGPPGREYDGVRVVAG